MRFQNLRFDIVNLNVNRNRLFYGFNETILKRTLRVPEPRLQNYGIIPYTMYLHVYLTRLR